MNKTALYFLASIAGASAFTNSAVQQQAKVSTIALNAADVTDKTPASTPASKPASTPASAAKVEVEEYPYKNALGAQAPLGYFDPLGLLYKATPEEFHDLRTKEIVHGRIAMLAFTGYITTYAGVRIPGCEDIPSGMAALSADWPAETSALSFITLACLVGFQFDYSTVYDDVAKPDFPGDFRNGSDRGNWNRRSEEYKLQKRGIELNNGRAAMMGWLGLVVHESMGNLDQIIPTNFKAIL